MDGIRLVSSITLVLTAACDAPQPPAGTRDPSAAPPAASASAPAPAARPLRRPDNAGELLLDDARRARIEAAHPEAKGFLDLDPLEKELFALELPRGAVDKALAAFDKKARGKWVLFTSRVIAPAEAFEVPVHYTARDAKDRLGLTSTWFPVRLDKIQGFDPNRYQPSDLVVVLAKYQGKQQAGPGFDLVFGDMWFEKPAR
jgi:hypothetical protein